MAVAAPLLAAALLALPAGALAHGDAHPGTAGPVAREQKPWGIAGESRGARTVEVRMGDDMRFHPQRIEVREGETVRFVVRNGGKLLHEMVIGTGEELRAHAELMRRFPKMEHDEPYMTHVKAGAKGEMLWNFNRPGTFQFACLVPGHFEAGMTGTIVVRPATPEGRKS
jgi:uncharacterized cupredoxin-like copper-binding protein